MSVRQARPRQLIYVALSGGVDSAVAASLLVNRGHRVVAVFMKPWQPTGMACLWKQDREDAAAVAARLGIPLKTWDFSRAYGAKVARSMVADYRAGRTPNPDVECNRAIKFGLFADRAFREGADAIATGHYAQLKMTNGEWRMTKARDPNKDQTYFLWAVPPAVLTRTLFPVGHLTKPQVRAIAYRAGLTVANKRDSQGVCFVGNLDVKSFLAARIRPRRGVVRHTDGRVLGTHDGAPYYTIGQRHGLHLTDGGGPHFVVRTDVRTNTVTVGGERELLATRARVTGLNWHGPTPSPSHRVAVLIRYRAKAVWATYRHGTVHFQKPVRAIAPGQSAVFYRNGMLLGGGVLA
jgi:tRNA-specific 2-thiouridylase